MEDFKCNSCGLTMALAKKPKQCPSCHSDRVIASDSCFRCGGVRDIANSRLCSKCRKEG